MSRVVARHAYVRDVTYRKVFSVGEYRALWCSQILSVAGDRLALVALTVLVFERTHSSLLTATTYAVSYLPWLLGGVLLAGLADKYSRRHVMVACDIARLGLVAIMTVRGMPLWALIALLFTVTSFEPVFTAARSAVVPDILPGDLYVLGVGISRLTNQIGFVLGFASGGIAVAALGPRVSLAVDAATFAASAILVRYGLRARAPARMRNPGEVAWKVLTDGITMVFRDPTLRILTFLGWLAAFYVVPEGLAAPYAKLLGGGPLTLGLLLAAMPAGTGVGVLVFGRLTTPESRLRLMGPLAVGSCLPLTGCALRPGLAGTLALLATAGACSAYQLPANALFVTTVPDQSRGQAFGIVMTGFSIGQGIALVAAGAVATIMPPPVVIAIAGGAGFVAAMALSVGWRRISPQRRLPYREPPQAPLRSPLRGRTVDQLQPSRMTTSFHRACDSVTGPGHRLQGRPDLNMSPKSSLVHLARHDLFGYL